MAEFLLGPLSREDGRLSRSWREGKVSGEGFLDDYANVAHGLLELHLATGEARFLTEAHRLALLAVDLFHDPVYGGFFLAPTGGEELVARTKGLDDNPIPSGNSMLAHVLLRLGRIWGDDELETPRRLGAAARGADAHRARRVPSAGRSARSTSGSRRRARSRSSGLPDSAVARAALAPFAPNTVAAIGPADGVPLLEGKSLVDGKPAVYVCERFACQAPVTTRGLRSRLISRP